MRYLLALIFALTLAAQAQVETLAVDGIFLGTPAAKLSFLPAPCPDGRYSAGGTTVEVQAGKVRSVSGEFLAMGHHQMAALGQPIKDLELTLGAPSGILYGCGQGPGCQIRFYKQWGITITGVEKVDGIQLDPVER